jgi:hypothetical protein
MYYKAKNFKIKEDERKQFIVVEKPKPVEKEKPKSMKQESKTKQVDTIGSEIIKIINSDKKRSENLLNNIECLNSVIGEYIFKKKSNNKDYENKLKAKDEKKELEQGKMMKKLEDQINEVMNKVETCLDNAKNVGKKPVKKQQE